MGEVGSISTALLGPALKFTLQLAVLHCISWLSSLETLSQLFFVLKWYRNCTITRTLYHIFSNLTCLSPGRIFLIDSISQGNKVSTHPLNTRQSEKLLQSHYFSCCLLIPTPLSSLDTLLRLHSPLQTKMVGVQSKQM